MSTSSTPSTTSTPVYRDLLARISELEIIDAHEHLGPEWKRLETPVDVFTLFSAYTRVDCLAAGMTLAQVEAIQNPAIPLEARWRLFEPFLEHIRHGSAARPAFIAAREFCGAEDVNERTYRQISERLAAHNTPGLYDRILVDKCHIRKSICVGGQHFGGGDPHLVYLTPMNHVFKCLDTRELLEECAGKLGFTIRTLDDLAGLLRWMIEKGAACGNPGIKIFAYAFGEPNRKEAEAVFARLMNGEQFIPPHYVGQVGYPVLTPLLSYLVDETLKIAAEFHRVVAVHSGVWGDFRQLNASHMIPVVARHPAVRFDIFHASMPYVRECAFMGKNFPNVWLNLCWTHIVSPMMTRSLLDEWMDIVPVNKIIGFGADYGPPVEKVYGHLVMARENIAQVLARRIEEGLMSAEQALAVAKKWLFDNPAGLYGLA